MDDDIALAEKLRKAKKDSADQALIVYEDTAIGRQAKQQAVDHSVTIQQIQRDCKSFRKAKVRINSKSKNNI